MIGYASANLVRCLSGAGFPASKASLIERARNVGAGQDAREILASLPEVEFESLVQLVEAIRDADQAPQTGIIDLKP
jgi:hypothetical protein